MARGIILSLQKKGYSLNLYDRTQKKAEELCSKNDFVCTTPEELAKKSEIIFAITADDNSSKQVWFGNNGAVLGLNNQTICVEMSTLSLEYLKTWLDGINEKGAVSIVCPMTGSRKGANTSSLTIFFGGDSVTFDLIKPILQDISISIFNFSKQIDAMKFKLIYNYFGASILLVFAEIMKIILENKYDVEFLFKILSTTGWGQIVVKNEYEKIIKEEYDDIECCLYNICKDIKYAYRTFLKGHKNNLEILDKVAQKYESLSENSELNKKDMSVVFNTIYLEEI